MAGDHSATTNFNKDVLIKELGLRQLSNTSIFKKGVTFVLSPSVQNSYNWFDLRKANLDRYVKQKENGYLLIRFHNKFLLCNLDDFLDKMVCIDNYVETKVSGVHWKFNMNPTTENKYIIVNRVDKKQYLIQESTINELKNIFNS